MIVFKKIRWKNFLSTGNVFTEINLDKNPNTLIVGENGAGKSTVLDALCFVLFNKPFRKVSKQQLVNTINTKGTVVEIEFVIGSTHYKVMRGIKKYGTTPFEIYVNDKLINQPGASRDYQAYLEQNVLKLNYKSFTQIVILGNASFTPFMQLSANHRREIIEDLLDLKIFTAMNMLLKEKISENHSAITEIKYKVDLAEEKLKVYQQALLDAQQNKKALIDSNKDAIANTNIIITTLNESVTTYENVVEDLTSKITDQQKMSDKLIKIQNLESQIENKIKRLKKDIKFFEENDNCPTCGQEWLDRQDQIDNSNKQLKETEDALEKLADQFNNVNNRLLEIKDIQEQITEAQSVVSDKLSEISGHQSYITKIQNDLSKLEDTQKDNTETKKNIKTLKIAKEKLDNKQEELVTEKQVLDTASDLLRDKGIKTRIVKQYIPVMNKLVNKYLAAMDFFVNFELNENFEEVIKSRHRDVFSYASFSEGEKMRIDLALLFTWRAIAKMKNSASTNLLILDEVFDASLDGAGCDEFLKLLHQMGKDANVFVISHKGDILADKFFSTIRFEKHKDFSRIVE